MTAEILEIPEVRQRVSPLSVEEYHRLAEYNEHGRRTELIRGIVIEKVSRSPEHSILASRLYGRSRKNLGAPATGTVTVMLSAFVMGVVDSALQGPFAGSGADCKA